MKVYVAVFMLCIIAAIMTTEPHNSHASPRTASQAQAQTVIAVNQQTPQRQQGDHPDNSLSLFHEYLQPPNVLNLALVIVGIIGIVIAICTVRTVRKQTNLMQAQFDQWVVLADWRTWNQPRSNVFRITVDLVNPTDFPITLSDGYLKFEKNGAPYIKYPLAQNTFLSPRLPKPIEFDISLTEAEQAAYSVRFGVDGIFSHFHKISGKLITQQIGGSLECSHWKSDMKWHVTFTEFVHMNPETQTS